ncbi:Uncharacterised protein [Candidatus Tiddalikarchaeum anstoanum]|nr:Uncharacterised protein [Candidatus Tiddalikarchaeum anstoanum]
MKLIKDILDSNEESLKQAASILNKSSNIIISGVGDKYYAAQITQFLTDAFYNKNVRVIHSRIIINYTPEWLDENTTCIFYSESGTTTEVVNAIKLVHDKKCKVLLFTDRSKQVEGVDMQIIVQGGIQSIISNANTMFIYAMMEIGLEVTPLLTIQTIDLPWDILNLAKNINLSKWSRDTAKKVKDLGINRFYFLGDGPRYPAAYIGAKLNKFESITMRSEGFEQIIPYDPKSAVVLLKPRESQVSEQALYEYNNLKTYSRNAVIEIDPFRYMEPRGIGKKLDILLVPLYIVVLENLMNELSKESAGTDSIP